MNHFSTFRQEVLQTVSDPSIRVLAKRVCLLFDLEGRLRVLAELEDSHDPNVFMNRVSPDLTTAAGKFWSKEFWFDRSKDHSMGKPNPSEKAVFDSVWKLARENPEAPDWLFTLDRRYSKESWFESGSREPWPFNPDHTPPILSFFSYKGGVGRTTALASLAIQCARAGKRVLILDFDLEAPGLASVFPPPSGTNLEVGLVDYLLERPIVGEDFEVGEIKYAYDNRSVIGSSGELYVVPAGLVDAWYLEKLARLDYHRFATELSPSKEHVLETAIKDLRRSLKPDIVFVDSRAGLHDLGGLALSSLSHWHVILGLDSDQSWAGVRLAISHLGRDRIQARQKQRSCLLVQSHVPPQEGRAESEERFRQRAYTVFCEEYYNDPNDPDAEWPVPDEFDLEMPHSPSSLVFDQRVMGYRSIDLVADYLCEGDYLKFANRLLRDKMGLAL